MHQYLSDIFESLKFRLLGGIFLVFFLAMGMVLIGINTYQRDRLLELSSQRALQLSDVIVAGLRSSMLQNDRVQSMQSIRSILGVAGSERISVLNPAGKIVMTSDPAVAGQVPDRQRQEPCRGCHLGPGRPARTMVQDLAGEKFIQTVTPILNEPACHRCHGQGEGPIGFLLVESSFAETTGLLHNMAERIVLTVLVALALGVLLFNSIITRFFTRPLAALRKGFTEVGRGNFRYWVEVEGGGEIGYMVDSFNVMSRAIDRNVMEIREKTEEVSAHYTIVDSLSQSIEKKVLKEVVVDLLARLLEADCVALALSVEGHPHLFEIIRRQPRDKRHYHEYYDADSGPPASSAEVCALTREDLLGWKKAGEFAATTYMRDNSKLLISLRHEGLALGLVSVVKPAGKTFRGPEKKIIPVLAHHISISFANAQLYHLAITDGLTTLYTKRYFQKKVEEAISRFHATKRGFCLLILDLDHFKAVNDEYGHPAGDQVLVRIAELIRANIRHGDLPFRYGGEEFVVLFQDDDLESAVRTAERIRLAVAKTALQIGDLPPFSKTVSIGISCFPHHFSTADELIGAADRALYAAKRRGRNQVVVYCRTSEDFSDCY